MKIKVADTGDFATAGVRTAEVGGKIIAIFKVADRFYAIDDTCTHAGASLSEGAVEKNEVECPWHGARFDLATGRALTMPATEAVIAYKVTVEGTGIFIEEAE